VEAGKVPLEDYWQVQHQLKASGAFECLYMVTDGTKKNTKYVIVCGNEDDFGKLMMGWQVFDQDVANYTPIEAVPEVIPSQVESLPAIRYEFNGLVLTSNLDQYKMAARQLIEDAKKKLETDQDFADATVRIKAFTEAEAKLKLVREAVLGEIDDVDRFCRDVAEIGESIRQARLASEKQVQNRKKEIRDEILTGGKQALAAHIEQINKTLGIVTLPTYTVDFAAAMKGKRNIDSLHGAVDDALAKAKLELNQIADGIRVNLSAYQQVIDAGLESEFRDLQQIVTKPADDFAMIVSMRIDAANRREEERIKQIKEAEDRKRQAETERLANQQNAQPTDGSKPEPHRQQAAKAGAGHPSFAAQNQGRQVSNRPTDQQIIEVLAMHYRVHESKVIEWLLGMDLNAASGCMVANI
jgi:hypothetical protein